MYYLTTTSVNVIFTLLHGFTGRKLLEVNQHSQTLQNAAPFISLHEFALKTRNINTTARNINTTGVGGLVGNIPVSSINKMEPEGVIEEKLRRDGTCITTGGENEQTHVGPY